MVCLFGNDSFYVSDPEAVVEIFMNQTRFPKDLKLYGMVPVPPGLGERLMSRGVGDIWTECGNDGGCDLETSSEDHE